MMPVKGFRQAARMLSAALLVLTFLGATSPLTAQTDGDRSAVLTVNSEFYRAFREGDRPAMDRVWGRRGEIAVEHPNGWKLAGRADVMQSWHIIMTNPPNITCVVEGVSFGQGRATVYCNEQLNPGSVRMKNIFHREDGAWKMIYHGPVPKDELVS